MATSSITTTTTTTTTQPPSSTIPLKSSSTSQSFQQSSVNAILNFFVPAADGSTPYNYVETPPEGVPRSNLEFAAHTVPIYNMRGKESTFSLDTHAFLPILASDLTSSSVADFDSTDKRVEETYYPEVEKLLLTNLSGSPHKVVIFDHTIRRSSPGAKREPVMRTHIDQTTTSARERVRVHLGDSAGDLLKARVRLINIWKPLNGSVESSPLAVADSSTVSDDLLVPVEHRYPHRTGETAAVKFSEDVKWWYWGGMDNEERLLLQCYDSEKGARVPHSASKLPDQEGKKGRESIEVRALVFG